MTRESLLSLPGFEPRVFQYVVQSLYSLRYRMVWVGNVTRIEKIRKTKEIFIRNVKGKGHFVRLCMNVCLYVHIYIYILFNDDVKNLRNREMEKTT